MRPKPDGSTPRLSLNRLWGYQEVDSMYCVHGGSIPTDVPSVSGAEEDNRSASCVSASRGCQPSSRPHAILFRLYVNE